MTQPNDLPDIEGLGEFLAPNQDKDQENPTQQPPKEDKADDLSDYDRQMLERLKNPKETLKHIKEIQGFATKLSQEKKTLEEKLAQLEQEKEELEYGQPIYHQPQQHSQISEETPEQMIERLVSDRVATERMKDILEDERTKNPRDFMQRYAVVQQLINANPAYTAKTHTTRGVRELFQKADEEIAKQYRSAALRAIEDIPDDLPPEQAEKVRNKLKVLLGEKTTQSKPSSAYMPDVTGASRTEPKQTNYDDEIAKAVEEGNLDKVAELEFAKHLST